jgi:alpha-L-fucosidase
MIKMSASSQSQPFEPDWASLANYRVPDWYADAKFGIFIHWGVYSVPAFANEWYPRNMYLPDTEEFRHHVATYGPHTTFGYKDYIPQFTCEAYDPAAWAELFVAAGARFVVPVAEHHDGFALYDTALTPWNAVQMGPKRDLVGELAAAVRAHGLVFGLSSHRAEHWWFMNGGRLFPSDVQDPAFSDFYGPATLHEQGRDGDLDTLPAPDTAYLDDWLARCTELVDKYQPQLVWFDWWIGHFAFEPYLRRFAAHYYNRGQEWGQGVAINYKHQCFPEGTAVLDIERGQLSGFRPQLWQNDTSVSKNSWSYVREQDYKTAESLIHDLIDVVSKNGALLLNIGPRADGTIPAPEQEILRAIGRWLQVNGEAIYATRPWHVFGEGPTEVPEGAFTDTERAPFTAADFRFTQKDGAVYAICLAEPQGEVRIRALAEGAGFADVGEVRLLGYAGEPAWRRDAEGLHIEVPTQLPSRYACTFRIR